MKYKNKEWIEEQLKSGLSKREVATKNGYSTSTVRRWMIKFNLWFKETPKYKNKEWLEEQVKNGLSGRQIAIRNGYIVSTVRKWMIKFNLWNYGVHPNSVNIVNVKRKKYKERGSWSRKKIEAIIARRANKDS